MDPMGGMPAMHQQTHYDLSGAQQMQQQQQQSELAHSFEHQLDLSQPPACAPLGGEYTGMDGYLDHQAYDLGFGGFEYQHDGVVQP
jgi:hypothetical protein